MIAKVHKANKLGLAVAKGEVELPSQEPTSQSERLKEQAPVHSEKKQRLKRKQLISKHTNSPKKTGKLSEI